MRREKPQRERGGERGRGEREGREAGGEREREREARVVSMYPASTSHTLVLPLRTNGRNHFSLEPCPLPSSLSGRLSEDEWATLLGRANRSLATHRSFGLSSLLLPFLAIDAASVALLYALTPRSLLAPLTVELPELLLPLLLELVLVLSAFPIVSALVNRRVRAVQAKAKEVFDEASRKYAARGVHFALKLGVHSAGAATNMWMEAQVSCVLLV